ncbi:hypothetical protein CDD80_6507 [Ophiocordyceps camponoti-rufipedis]|uniref:Glyoxalase-like domain-containing protein n=1 Tax=Ophiocordyceps camponoti-rufipedis TaxID=2004952 RepID=A0A2C5YR29_9HYPO|nr:hypothetical protein CDD80_6507 [Ophiocordyceps camponoti-rufipedis]
MDKARPRPILDHVVVLVTHDTLRSLEDRLKASLLVSPGGTHADGLTENKLIVLDDGSYIELIAFIDGIDPDRRRAHRWGLVPENTAIDWAYTLPHESDFAGVQRRLGAAGVAYSHAEPGGRTLADGTDIKWAVAFPRDGPGRLPFWCLDRTPRRLRVPSSAGTRHPCGARGVARLVVRTRPDDVTDLTKAYDALHGDEGDVRGRWSLDVCTGGRRFVTVEASESRRGLEMVLLGGTASSIEVVAGLRLCIERETME